MAAENKEPKSVFETLNGVNVNGHTEKKNNLTYLSWAWAWAEIKKAYPDAFYTIYEDAEGCFYHNDGRTAWVKTGVTINGLEHIEYLPVMDYKNRSIPVGELTSFDVNKAIQRSLTKACARHGLGLYIYAGEDLPETEADAKEREEEAKEKKRKELKDKGIMGADGYPVDKIMLENCTKYFQGENLKKLLDYYKAEKLTDLSHSQLMTAWCKTPEAKTWAK